MAIKHGILCLLPILVIIPSHCAPKSRKQESPHTVYDQKQTGDYNIQLHLKDFQIIALLADDSGAFGDYDYSYDYSDFTVKPPSSGTQKPSDASTIPSFSTTPSVPDKPTSPKPTKHPYPIVSPTTEQPPPTKEEPPKKDHQSTIDQSTINTTAPNENPVAEVSTTPKVEEVHSPGKIKVQIIGAPMNVGIVPGEDLHEDNGEALPHGEVSQLKRCSTGFTRDKRGRCRRVRRPASGTSQLPYGFSRLASNLASRFRQASSDASMSSASESAEN